MNAAPLARDYLQPLLAQYLPDMQLAILMRLLLYVGFERKLLPLDRTKCAAIAQARSTHQLSVLDQILAEHFDILDSGRCPRQLLAYELPGNAAFDAAEPCHGPVTVACRRRDATVTTAPVTPSTRDRDRQRRQRERREALANKARENGFRPLERHTMAQLRDMANGIGEPSRSRDAGVTAVTLDRDSRERALADLQGIPNTEAQQPLAALAARAQGVTQGVTPLVPRAAPTPAGAAALAMKAAGLQAVNPSHPELAALLQGGVTVEELASAAQDAAERGKGFAYALATARGRRADAARAGDVAQASKDDALARWAPSLAAKLRGGVA